MLPAFKSLRWFYGVLWRYRRHFLHVILAVVFINILSLATPLITMAVVDRVLVSGSLSTLYILGIALTLALLLSGVLAYIKDNLFLYTANCISAELAGKIFRHLLSLPTGFFVRRPVGELLTRLGEITKVRQFLTDWVLSNALDLTFTLFFLLVMASISGELTLLVLAMIPFHLIQYIVYGPRLRRYLREQFTVNAAYQSRFIESLSGMETIKASGSETSTLKRLEQQFSASLLRSFHAGVINNKSGQLSGFISSMADASILIYGAMLVISQELTLGQLIAIRMLSGRVSGPILRFAGVWEVILDLRISLDRLNDILTAEPEHNGEFSPDVQDRALGFVAARNLSFSYDGVTPVLQNASFCIPRGHKVLLQGVSGSGKSTLVKLMPGLLPPSSGELLVGGVDVAQWQKSALRRLVRLVPQSSAVFAGTIADNIAFGKDTMEPKRLHRAARIACLDEFINTLPHGYNTPVEENGQNLSGGQRQRLTLARAFYSNAQVIILDEATSALDDSTERRILGSIYTHLKNTTVLMISHRSNIERYVDQVMTIDSGRVVHHHGQALLSDTSPRQEAGSADVTLANAMSQ